MARNETPFAYEDFGNWKDWLRSVARTVNLILKGKSNNTATLTLTANATTTTLSNNLIGPYTGAHLEPVTANAAAALATTYQEDKPNANNGAIVFTHANNAQTDRKFIISLIG